MLQFWKRTIFRTCVLHRVQVRRPVHRHFCVADRWPDGWVRSNGDRWSVILLFLLLHITKVTNRSKFSRSRSGRVAFIEQKNVLAWKLFSIIWVDMGY